MSKTKIGKLSLKNEGGFVAKLQFVYWDDQGEKHHVDGTGDITLGLTKTADPGDYGIPDGADVALYAFVVWGIDHEATRIFTYEKGNKMTAHYIISGTTTMNDLGLTDIG